MSAAADGKRSSPGWHEQAQRARAFRELHERDGVFVMPNAWDPPSAVLLEDAGFEAIGTTSSGVAHALGKPDYAGRVTRAETLDATRRIVEAVGVPVSVDAEAGYGPTSDDVAETVRQLAAAGAAGCSIEDFTGDAQRGLYDRVEAVERVRAAREAADASGVPFTLTGRAECYLVGHADPFAESVVRANLYRAAGADCLFVPGPRDLETIAALVREIDGPINVVVFDAEAGLTVDALGAAGVRRISLGGSLARATFGLIRRIARHIRETGSFEMLEIAIGSDEIEGLLR